MNDYYSTRITLTPCTEDITDYVAALLGDIGYESFVPDAEGLTAYVKAELYNPEATTEVLNDLPFETQYTIESEFVEGRDWNAEWEKNYFKPIVVGDECVIHSSFHTDVPAATYDIVIDPKMAFGTGHHATTSLIITRLLTIDLEGKSVIDMGTGTGILAILCAMRGASPVWGIEIDGFAYDNALDNIQLNHHPEIKLINGDANALKGLPQVDVFIANINRNVILADLEAYAAHVREGGTMLLSGFYEADILMIEAEAKKYGLSVRGHQVKGDNWTCVSLIRQ